MADLGIRAFNPSATINFQQGIVQGISALGAQLRNDLTTVQTNKQLQGLAGQLQGIDVKGPDFEARTMQAISANPLAMNTPAGKSAIGMLGSARETYLREQAASAAWKRQVEMFGMTTTANEGRDIADFWRKKALMEEDRKYRLEDEERKDKKPIVRLTDRGLQIGNPETKEITSIPDPNYIPPVGRVGAGIPYGIKEQIEDTQFDLNLARKEAAKSLQAMYNENAAEYKTTTLGDKSPDRIVAKKQAEMIREKATVDAARVKALEAKYQEQLKALNAPPVVPPAARPSIPATDAPLPTQGAADGGGLVGEPMLTPGPQPVIQTLKEYNYRKGAGLSPVN